MGAIITTAGLDHIAALTAAGQTLDIDEMVFANVAGLDPAATPPAAETMPDPGDIVHQAALTSTGKVGDDTVVYSKLLGTDIGPFTFNWIGLYDSVNDVLVGVSYVPEQLKTASAGSTTGNSLVKNFAVQYTNIASIANVTIDAATWQIDITATLDGMQAEIDSMSADLAQLIAAFPAALAATNTIGQIIWYPKSTPPANFLECAGQAISRTTYADLFAVLGITFGAGDGASTFNLPDLRGQFIRGWDHGAGIDPDRVFGAEQLDAIQTITGSIVIGQDPSGAPAEHTGAFEYGEDVTSDRAAAGGTGDERVTFDSSRVTRGADETRPRNVALMPCIRYAGGPDEVTFPDVTGPQGDPGTPGADGRTILTTDGAPLDATGENGDYAIDPGARLLYGPKAAGTWPAPVSLGGVDGADGVDGAPGADGADGADGRTILSTTGAPDNGTGVDGDYALDITAQLLYGPKAAGVWPAGVSIQGDQGPTGPQGTPWSVIDSGRYTALPASTSRITMSDTTDLHPGLPLRYTYGGTTYWGKIAAVSAAAYIDIMGPPLDPVTALTELAVGRSEQNTAFVLMPDVDAYGDAVAALEPGFPWLDGPAYLVGFRAWQKTEDGSVQPKCNLQVDGVALSTADGGLGLQLSTAYTAVEIAPVSIDPAVYQLSRGSIVKAATTAAGGSGGASMLTMIAEVVLP